MKIKDRVAVVTGGGSGIGAAVARKFHEEGAAHVVVADLDGERAKAVASEFGGTGVTIDVSDESAIQELVQSTEAAHGKIDVFFSNAGYVTVGGLEIDNEEMTRMFDVHVMAHIYAARAVLPAMIERGEGYLVSTASAAGLLSQIGSLAYSVTKHAAVSLAEWLAITHGPQGIRVSVLCPQAVKTRIGENSPSREAMKAAAGVAAGDGVLSSEETAETVVAAMDAERFWILPHKEVSEYVMRKATDVDRWLGGMQRFQERLYEGRDLPGTWLVDS